MLLITCIVFVLTTLFGPQYCSIAIWNKFPLEQQKHYRYTNKQHWTNKAETGYNLDTNYTDICFSAQNPDTVECYFG